MKRLNELIIITLLDLFPFFFFLILHLKFLAVLQANMFYDFYKQNQ